MLSTPPAMNTSPSPALMARAASLTACKPDAAQAIDRAPGHVNRQPGQQDGHARHVAVVLARLVSATQDYVFYAPYGPLRCAPPGRGSR